MVSQELIDYVKKELEKGISKDKIMHILMDHDWPEFEINEAFEKAKMKIEVDEAIEEDKIKPSGKPVELKEQPCIEIEEPIKQIFQEQPEEQIQKEETIEEKPKIEVEKPKEPLIETIKKIITNKFFIIGGILLILTLVVSFLLPSIWGGEKVTNDISQAASDNAKSLCGQYCNSNLCGLVNNPEFTHPELEGKTCKDLGFPCLQPNGKSKCEVKY